jgi:hypothetical protein
MPPSGRFRIRMYNLYSLPPLFLSSFLRLPLVPPPSPPQPACSQIGPLTQRAQLHPHHTLGHHF